ncbi:hypothetical protein D6827_01150 [Candidatus Parcubacteria bacterium]|nr:MAG: hypothetical protein D6827_01150 [Candidatus Parcubacteria bacterium]
MERFLRGILEERRALILLTEKYGFSLNDADKILAMLKTEKNAREMKFKSAQKIRRNYEPSNIEVDETEVLNKRHAALAGKVDVKPVEPVLPGARISLARSKKDEINLQKQKIDAEKLKRAEESLKPEPAKVKLSSPSTPPLAMSNGKAPVTDIKYTPKLIGPIEELGTMTVADFRRVASDINIAAEKILDKFKLLQEESYTDYLRGLNAWRKSPINSLYLKLLHESLDKGQSLSEIAASYRAKGMETLNPAEIEAVMEINKKIEV